MAMMKCPECGRDVSDRASKCPQCGYPIQEYLNERAKESNAGNRDDLNEIKNEPLQDGGGTADVPKPSEPEKKKTRIAIIAAIVCVAIVAVIGIVFGSGALFSSVKVDDITIGKWRLMDSSKYTDTYEGTITSDQKKPFVAVIGRYDDEDATPNFVYMEDGKGIFDAYLDTDEDPSTKYRPLGYLGGTTVNESNVRVSYSDGDYSDWEYSESSNCIVTIDIDMKNGKSGLLIFDVENETNNETDTNLMVNVIDGKGTYSYYASLPYKARGVDVSMVPKFFCASKKITEKDYTVEKAYTAEKEEGDYSNSYSGEETLTFDGYDDGFVLYTKELKEGGQKENRNEVQQARSFLHNGECTISTYDAVDVDENILMPKYEFHYVGYVGWTSLEGE